MLLGWLQWLGRQLKRAARNLAGYTLVHLVPPVGAALIPPTSRAWVDFSIDNSECYQVDVSINTTKGFELSSLSDFDVNSIQRLASPPEHLFMQKMKSLMPYAYDFEHDMVVLVEVRDGEDPLEDKRFLYQAQHSRTSRVFLIPPAEYVRALNTVCPDSDILQRAAVLHSTGRCGSTLLSKTLQALGNTESLNEPDIFTCLLPVFNKGGEANAALVGAIARAALLQLVSCRLAHYTKERAAQMVIWIKTRGAVVYYAKLMKMYVPEVKQVYLYRNAVDYTDSACSGFVTKPAFKFARYTGMDGFLVWTPRKHKNRHYGRHNYGCLHFAKGSDVQSYPWHLGSGLLSTPGWSSYVQSLKKDDACYNCAFRIGFVGAMALAWQENVVHAQQCCSEGVFQAVLRYEELVKHREAMVLQLIEQCGFTSKSNACEGMASEAFCSGDLVKVFQEDAHSGSKLQSSRVASDGSRIKETVFIRPSELEDLVAVINHHPVVSDPHIILPGSLMVGNTTEEF